MNKLDKKKKIIIIVILAIAIGLGYYFLVYKDNEQYFQSENILVNVVTNSNYNTNTNVVVEKEKIFVYVSGAVNKPGVIQLDSNNRVKDAIEVAGGLKENADLTNINLAEILEDESKIYIPELGEKQAIEENEEITKSSASETKKLSVNINTASNKELQNLPGIGEATAEKIIEFRKQNGKFSSIEDIKKVSGIGESKFNKIKDYIKVK